jgi:MFS family permease
MRRQVRERIAIASLFGVFGAVLATWAVQLPAVKQATAISSSMLGGLLLVVGLGSLIGMFASAPIIDTFGSTRVAVVAASLMATTVVAPLSAHTVGWAALGALGFGLAMGITDVAMNAAAVLVQRKYGRPIMAAFHACFSVGTVVGSLAGALCASVGVSASVNAIAAAATGLLVIFTAAALQRGIPLTATNQVHAAAQPDNSMQRRQTAILGVLAFLLFLAEGSAMDWSNLHAQQHLGVSPSTGSLVLASFVTSMTVGRFAVDRIVARVGPTRLLRCGSLAAAVGLAVIMVSPVWWVALFAWAIVGLGLAGGAPQVFTAAGSIAENSSHALSRVVGVGYIAVIGGPGVIGALADAVSLNLALALPFAAVLVCGLAAGAVDPAGNQLRCGRATPYCQPESAPTSCCTPNDA